MIQIDMEMPKNCLDCNLRYQSFCSVDGHYEPHLEKERCPLKVTPQEPKTGHWIEHPHEAGANWEFSMYECSECHVWEEDDSNYCPNCGAKMVEPQESEDKE